MTTQRQLDAQARRLVRLLEKRDLQIVFAESCTGGLVSATLTRIPGVSAHHCGSAVVYQVETKQAWLGVPTAMLQTPGPVSRAVAAEMAGRVLQMTPQADVAASITGHLGPDAPAAQDGLIFVGVAMRSGRGGRNDRLVTVEEHWLTTMEQPADRSQSAERRRVRRQMAAAERVLQTVCAKIDEPDA